MMDIINLLELDIEGVTLEIADYSKPGAREAGEYLLWSHTIRIRREISKYWFATFTTLLHEYGHHRQRPFVFSFVGATVALLCFWILYVSRALLNIILLASFMAMLALLLKMYYLEWDANTYAASRVPEGVYMFLSEVEVVLIATSFSLDSTRRALRRLHRMMRRYTLELFP